jgi:predicted amidohydrolase
VLLRARAIENGAFVIAPAQCGVLDCGAEVYGHSLIVDPWGRVLADGGEAQGFVTAEIDLRLVHEARRKIPALSNARAFDPPTWLAN